VGPATETLKDAYRKNHLALGLGAGVSQASRLPGWHELVCRVAETLPGVGRATAETLLRGGYEPAVLATYLRGRAAGEGAFVAAVRQALYRDFTFPEPVRKGNHRRFAAHVRETNPTLHAVGSMCAVRVGRDRYQPNPRIRAVVTLNLDDLVQEYTHARFKAGVLRTVERASASASAPRPAAGGPPAPARIHLYHVHGYLVRHPRPGRDPDRAHEADDRLVLTEQQYVDVVANASGFVTYTLLYLLREHQFLFVGLSMTDPNLRRALHLSCSERVRELLAEGEPEARARRRATRHWAVLMRRGPTLDDADAALLAVLGVTPLWVRDWGQIPVLLRAVYEAGGRDWSGVA
jgi:hypothetical protein